MKKSYFFLLIVTVFLAFGANLSAHTKVSVKFAKGATSAALKGTISGYKYTDYIVAAKSGQTLMVKLQTSNPASGFYMYYSDLKEVDETSGVMEITRNVDVDDKYTIPRDSAAKRGAAQGNGEFYVQRQRRVKEK